MRTKALLAQDTDISTQQTEVVIFPPEDLLRKTRSKQLVFIPTTYIPRNSDPSAWAGAVPHSPSLPLRKPYAEQHSICTWPKPTLLVFKQSPEDMKHLIHCKLCCALFR